MDGMHPSDRGCLWLIAILALGVCAVALAPSSDAHFIRSCAETCIEVDRVELEPRQCICRTIAPRPQPAPQAAPQPTP